MPTPPREDVFSLGDDGLPSGVVTFLFTDVEGSTRLWDRHPDAMRAALERHDILLRAAIDAQGGHVFKATGDAFFAAFHRPQDALRAALDAQIALHAEPWSLPAGDGLRVRMALHTGAAQRRGGDYFGLPLSRAARLLAAAHGGQTLVSEAGAALLDGLMPGEASLHSLGRHRLKDLAQPQEVFALRAPGLADGFPPLRSLEAFAHNLPAQLTSFVGREAEMRDARARLGGTRLLTLTGTGGAGKTRLALQVAADALDGFPDGAWLTELAALADPALVTQAVAGVLGVREEADRPLRQSLADSLQSKRLLLLWDNCEHLVESCARLADWLLRACPGVIILATSRESLDIGGEAVLALSSLPLPGGPPPPPPDELLRFDSVRLFVERATEAQASFRFSAGNAQAVASVCSRLDGIPLALELAAARVRVLTPAQISDRLDDRFRLLTGGSRTALPRQQTLRALIDWSYDLLAPAEQTLLRRLSVFAGGWPLEAAEAVCAGGDVEDWEVLDLLARLVAKSLVVAEPPEGGQVRYRLLENVRGYAHGRLAETGGEEALADRHAGWFLGRAEEAEPHLSGAAQAEWLGRLEQDRDNLRAALRRWQATDSARLLRLAGALSRFWYGRSYLSEGGGWLRAALDAAGPDADGGARGKALNGAGMLAWACGELDQSAALHAQDLALRREAGDDRGVARALANLGILAVDRKDMSGARVLFEESLGLYRALGNDDGVTVMLNNLGGLASDAGDHAESQRLLEEGLALFRQAGNAQGIAASLHNLGKVSLALDRPGAAKRYCRESLAVQQSVGNTQRIASSLANLAEAEAREGGLETACLLLAAAGGLLASSGIPPMPADFDREAALAQIRLGLGEEAFRAAWERGRRMSQEQVLRFVLGDGADMPPL